MQPTFYASKNSSARLAMVSAWAALTAALAAGLALPLPALAQTAEVVDWWTSRGASAAVQELAAAYRTAGDTRVGTAIAGGDNARNLDINRNVGGKPPTVSQFNATSSSTRYCGVHGITTGAVKG